MHRRIDRQMKETRHFTTDEWELAQNGDQKMRNKILLSYQYLIDYAVKNVSSNIPSHVSREDLFSNGQFGLFQAIDRYDPSAGFKFETFAIQRIRGSVLDSLRDLDWVPRSVRSRERMLEQATEELSQTLGRRPTMDEVIDYSGLDEFEIYDTQYQVENGFIQNLESPIGDDFSQTIGDLVPADISSMGDLADIFDSQIMADCIVSLPEREYLTISLHYYMGETLAQIGSRFGVTESRICQIHTRALKMIRQGILA